MTRYGTCSDLDLQLSRKPEAGSRKPEAGSRKPEAGSRKPEAGSRKPQVYARIKPWAVSPKRTPLQRAG